MSGLLAITARELRVRWPILGLALALGFAPLAVPLDAPDVLAAVSSLTLGAAAALVMGFSSLGRDLSGPRAAFFFSRPLAWWGLWGSKLLATVLITAGSTLLAGLPWLASERGLWTALISLAIPGGGAVLALSGLILIGLAHLAGVASRSRSKWILVDLSLLGLAVYGCQRTIQHLALIGALPLGGWDWALILGLVALPLTAASAVQVAIGRTDPRRGHLAQSLTLWTALLPLLGLAGGYVAWVERIAPNDVHSLMFVAPAPRGPWTWLCGSVSGRGRYVPSFVLDTTSGAFVRAGTFGWGTRPAFTSDGGRAAGVQPTNFEPDAPLTLSLVDLTEKPPRMTTHQLSLSGGWARAVVLSRDGTRLAVLQRQAMTVLGLDPPRSIASLSLSPPDAVLQIHFAGGDRLRAYRRLDGATRTLPGEVEILDLDIRSGTAQVAGHFESRGKSWLRLAPDGERFLALHRPDFRPSVTLHGPRGDLLATLVATGSATHAEANFMADGRIAVVESLASTRLRILSPGGEEEWALTLAESPLSAHLGGEVAAGRLIVGLHGRTGAGAKAIEVDLIERRIAQSWDGLDPVLGHWSYGFQAMADRVVPGEPGTQLFLSPQRGLLRVNPTTGERTVLLGGKGGD